MVFIVPLVIPILLVLLRPYMILSYYLLVFRYENGLLAACCKIYFMIIYSGSGLSYNSETKTWGLNWNVAHDYVYITSASIPSKSAILKRQAVLTTTWSLKWRYMGFVMPSKSTRIIKY